MVRDYRPSDLDRILKIWLQANIQAHDFIDRSYWEENSGLVRQLLPQARVFVWEQGGEIQGFAGIVEENIEGIFVSEQYRSKGIRSGASPGGKAPLPPAHIAGLPKKTDGLFCFISGKGLL